MSGKFDELFNQAFEKFDECMKLASEGIDSLLSNTNKRPAETRILVKAGSTVYLGKGVYAKLSEDVNAILIKATSDNESESTTKKNIDIK